MQALRPDRLDDEVDGAGAHGRDDVVDAAVRRLHDHRHADPRLTQSGQYAEAVKVWHDQIEDHAIDPGTVGGAQQRQCGVAVVARHRLVAEFLQHAFEQPALHRIIVDDENSHQFLGGLAPQVVPFRGTVAEGA